jgi:hypothetical protein
MANFLFEAFIDFPFLPSVRSLLECFVFKEGVGIIALYCQEKAPVQVTSLSPYTWRERFIVSCRLTSPFPCTLIFPQGIRVHLCDYTTVKKRNDARCILTKMDWTPTYWKMKELLQTAEFLAYLQQSCNRTKVEKQRQRALWKFKYYGENIVGREFYKAPLLLM